MRLSEQQKILIKTTIKEYAPDSEVLLFGSRVDDTLKGGDIDLLVITKRNSFLDSLKLKTRLKEKIGEQKIDLILTDNLKKPFVKDIYRKAVSL